MRVGKSPQYADESEANELMSKNESRRNWKGIGTSVLIIIALAIAVALIITCTTPPESWPKQETVSLADIVNGRYKPKTFDSSIWITSDTFMYMNDSNLWCHNVTENTYQIAVHSSTWKQRMDSFYPSPSGKYILYSYNKTKEFTFSYFAQFEVVTPHFSQNVDKHSIRNSELLQYASWGPGDQIVYVLDNNIYYLEEYSSSTPWQVTNDGLLGVVFNGIPDWAYKNEILTSDGAIWWSPGGRYFAYMKINDTEVNNMSYVVYGTVENCYPRIVDFKYPKPGFNIPDVSIWVADTNSSISLAVNFTTEEYWKNYCSFYVTSVTWADENTLAIMWGPRAQNSVFLSLCESTESSQWTCSVKYEEESLGWLEPRIPLFTQDARIFFIIKSNNITNFKHIFMQNLEDGTSGFLTEGEYEVTSILYYNNDNRTLYFIRTDCAEKRRVYRLTINSNTTAECLSCKKNCDWATASVSPGGTYYARSCSSVNSVPITTLVNSDSNEVVRAWETNEELKKSWGNWVVPKVINHTITVSNPTDGRGDKINIRLLLPSNFSDVRKYPVIVNAFRGPGSQMNKNNYEINFGTYLATARYYLYVTIDGRGSGGSGDKTLFQVYKRLGTVEIEDMISATRFLMHNISYVDPNRIAVWGWSYGGYAAAMAIAKGRDIFSCAASVAPVTSWRYYDSIYSERYMSELENNPDGYKNSELMDYVSDFNNKRFLLLHGTADDKVHLQQSMMLTKALNDATFLFNMHLYPDESHSISKSKLHVYLTIEAFFANCFA